MKRTLVLSAIALFGALQTFAAEPPRLIVQIVVGSMRAEDLNRYAANFGEGGFRRLTDGGTVYTDCRYDFQQTTTPVALATLSTGAMPSTHGVIGARWIDYTSNRSIGLIDGDRGPAPTSSSPRRSAKPCASTTPRAGRPPWPPKRCRPW